MQVLMRDVMDRGATLQRVAAAVPLHVLVINGVNAGAVTGAAKGNTGSKMRSSHGAASGHSMGAPVGFAEANGAR